MVDNFSTFCKKKLEIICLSKLFPVFDFYIDNQQKVQNYILVTS